MEKNRELGNSPRATRPPVITLLDIETAPLLGYSWGIWETNVMEVKEAWYMLSFSVKRLGSKKASTYCLPDFYKKDKQDDKSLITELWNIMDKSDVIIAHNGDRFDIRKANARFIFHGMEPPST